MNGGQVALTGFRLQVLWAIFDGIDRDDWNELRIEPEDQETIDVAWVLPTAERHDQVKSTTSTFGRSEIKDWLNQLATRPTAAERRLVLIGVPASGIKPEEQIDGITILICPREERVLHLAVAALIEKTCRGMGVLPAYDQGDVVIERLVGVLLVGASSGRSWSRSAFFTLLRDLVEGVRRPSPQVVDPVIRAKQVQAAMHCHGMSRSRDQIQRGKETIFRFCDWPPPSYADPDGYHETIVRLARGPGDHEATGCCHADRIVLASPVAALRYRFHGMGADILDPPFIARAGEVLMYTGEPYDGAYGPIRFQPEPNEIIVLRNGKHTITEVRYLEERQL